MGRAVEVVAVEDALAFAGAVGAGAFDGAATFVGAASVPTGLICLGSALARMQVPMNKASLEAMPVGAIGALAIGKVVISPILGVLICQGLTSAGVIDKDDAVLRFVCM